MTVLAETTPKYRPDGPHWLDVADEAALLILCLRGAAVEVPEAIDWRSLRSLAEENGVLLPLDNRLTELGTCLPDSFHLAALAARAAADSMAAQLEFLLGAFHERGIETLPLKGPAMALALYGDAAMRPANDLDLLVRRAHFACAEAVLLSLGFRALGPAGDHDRRFLCGDLLVELHFELACPRFFPFDAAAVWSRSSEGAFRAQPFRALHKNDLALYLCAHGLKHGFSRLIWILDLARSLAGWSAGEYRELLRQARREGSLAWLLIGCEVVRTVFPEQLAEELDEAIAAFPKARERARRAARRLFPEATDAEAADFRALYLEAEAGPLARWRYRLRYFARTRADDAWARRHRIHPRLMPLLRPLRLVEKYGLARVWRILFPSGA